MAHLDLKYQYLQIDLFFIPYIYATRMISICFTTYKVFSDQF